MVHWDNAIVYFTFIQTVITSLTWVKRRYACISHLIKYDKVGVKNKNVTKVKSENLMTQIMFLSLMTLNNQATQII